MPAEINHLKLVEPELSGGQISKQSIDQIESCTADELTISGLRQDTFELLLDKYGAKFEIINFWKCPKVEDLSPLESLGGIRKITWFWNQKATSLWDLSKNTALIELHLRDFSKVRSIAQISKSARLERLELEGGMQRISKIDSLEPLANLPKLKFVIIDTPPIDQRLDPLARISELEELEFAPNMFTAEQIAWLKSKIGNRVKSEVLAPFLKADGISNFDTLIIGKRKPFLNSHSDKVKIEKYIQKFQDLVEYYTLNPEIKEPA